MMKKWFKPTLFLYILLLFGTEAWADQPTQFSIDGNFEAKLLRAQIKEGVLTVNVALKNISEKNHEPQFCFGKVYFADLKEKIKYKPLKDSNGNWIAGPVRSEWCGGTFKERIGAGMQKLFWVKFPAPTSGIEKIDLFFPNLLPFEGVDIN